MSSRHQSPEEYKERYILRIKQVGAKLEKGSKKTQFHKNLEIDKYSRNRSNQLFGIRRYGGELHAGDLSLRKKATEVLPRLLVEWGEQVALSASHIYFVTICPKLGQTSRDMRHLDVHRLKTQVSNLIANHFKEEATVAEWFGMMDLVEVRGQVPGFNGPTFHAHFHGVFASNRSLPRLSDMNAKTKALQSTTMPGASIHYRKLDEHEVLDHLQRIAVYMVKTPYEHTRWTAETAVSDDGVLEILNARTEKTSKLSHPSLFMQLEHLRLLDFPNLIQASGKNSNVLKKGIMQELKQYYDTKIKAGYGKGGCGCKRKEFSVGLRKHCAYKMCDWEILRLLRERAADKLGLEDAAESTVIRSVRESGMRDGIELIHRM